MSESDEERIARIDIDAAAAWDRLKSGEHWSDWRYLSSAFAEGRRWAMHRAGTNRPEGKHYARFFSEWMAPRPWSHEVDKPTRASLLWYSENAPAVEAWLPTVATNQRLKWNHPTTIRKQYTAANRVSAGGQRADLTPMQKKDQAIAALEEENVKLKRELARRDNGSLFDLVHDSASDIIKAIAANPISSNKMRELGKGLAEAAKEKEKRQRARPAG